jgi:predicted nucleic acid-binding protein
VAAASGAAGLTDTDILIDAARGIPDAVAILSAQRAGAGISISIISSMELVAGCRDAAELRQIQQFLRQVTALPVGASISQAAHQLMESYSLSHGLQIPDALIAVTALEYHLTLYTKNTRHFQMIPGLTVHRPY